MEDERIIQLFFNRSEMAIKELHHKYGKICHKLSFNILQSLQDAEECVNDAYLGVWNTVPPTHPNPLLAYVCRIVRNLSIKRYRSNTAQKRNSIYDVAISELEGCMATTKTVEEEVDARELKELLYAFLDSLSKENRVIFVRRYWFTDSYEQIAGRVGMSEKNVSVRLVRIRKQLREYLEEGGGDSMRIEPFLQVIDELDDKYVTEAIRYQKKNRTKITKWLTIAACVCLLLGVGIDTIQRYEFFLASCGANIGKIVDGTYYYHVQSDGVYGYSPEEGSKRLLSTYWYQDFDVNEYGIYYKQGRSLYVQVHETGERRKLYRAGLFDSSHIGFTLQEDGNVIVTVYNKRKEYQYELLLDGMTGEILSTVMEKTPYSAGGIYYSRSHFTLDDRALDLVEVGKTNDYDLLENGKSILPEGKLVERYSMVYIGDNLWFYVNDFADVSGGEQEMFVVRPDGKDEIKILPFFEVYTGNNAYLFFSEVSSNEMWCFDIETGESWTLEMDQDLTLYSVTSDGAYVYSCAPWGEAQIQWKLVYDENGKPAAMRLVDKNIRD